MGHRRGVGSAWFPSPWQVAASFLGAGCSVSVWITDKTPVWSLLFLSFMSLGLLSPTCSSKEPASSYGSDPLWHSARG